MKTIVGLFDERSEAQRVYDDLVSQGFTTSEISQLTSDASNTTALSDLSGNIPADDMQFYKQGVQQGGALVVAHVDDSKATSVASTMARYNMVDVDERATSYRASGSDVKLRDYDESDHVLPVIEEQIQVGKRAVERGRMRVYSTVTEKPVEEQVQLREEHVNVERRPVNRDVTSADLTDAFKEQSFEMTEMAEEAVVAKQARVVEEVVIGKQTNERTETIRDTVRRTDVNVENMPAETVDTGMVTDVTTARATDTATTAATPTTTTATTTATTTTGARTFDTYGNDYRTYYDTNLKDSGYTYDQLSPVYHYGYDLANDDRYANKDWSTFESDARTSWEKGNPGTWENFKDTVRYAWERARAKV